MFTPKLVGARSRVGVHKSKFGILSFHLKKKVNENQGLKKVQSAHEMQKKDSMIPICVKATQ